MKFWKNWPYWLRGGAIGGGIAIIFCILFFCCNLITTADSFLCLPFVLLSPLYPIAMLIDHSPWLRIFPVVITLPILSLVFWFIPGAFIAIIIKVIKKSSLS